MLQWPYKGSSTTQCCYTGSAILWIHTSAIRREADYSTKVSWLVRCLIPWILSSNLLRSYRDRIHAWLGWWMPVHPDFSHSGKKKNLLKIDQKSGYCRRWSLPDLLTTSPDFQLPAVWLKHPQLCPNAALRYEKMMFLPSKQCPE